MRKISVTQSTQGVSEWMPVDRRGTSGDDYLVVVELQGGNLVDFEFSPDRVGSTDASARDDPTLIIQHDVLCDLTESCASTLMVPFQSFRLNVKDHAGGDITATVVQGGLHGN